MSGHPQEAAPSTEADAEQRCGGNGWAAHWFVHSQGHVWRHRLLVPPWSLVPRPQDTYMGDRAAVRDGALGRHPRAGDALGDASSWNRAQRRPWKT